MDARIVYKVQHDLAEAAARLESHSTIDWKQFVVALGQHAELYMAEMLTASHTNVHNAQGKAAALNDLCNVLHNPKEALARAVHMAQAPNPANNARKPAN